MAAAQGGRDLWWGEGAVFYVKCLCGVRTWILNSHFMLKCLGNHGKVLGKSVGIWDFGFYSEVYWEITGKF